VFNRARWHGNCFANGHHMTLPEKNVPRPQGEPSEIPNPPPDGPPPPATAARDDQPLKWLMLVMIIAPLVSGVAYELKRARSQERAEVKHSTAGASRACVAAPADSAQTSPTAPTEPGAR
jgi:hypothetical protein